MALDLKQYIFKRPDNGRYFALVGGLARELTDPPSVIEARFGKDIPTKAWSADEGIRSTTSGSLDNFEQTVKQSYENSLPYISSFYQRDLDNPDYAYVSKGTGGGQLVPRSSLADWQSLGWNEISDPKQRAERAGYSYNPAPISAADAANNARVKEQLAAERAAQANQTGQNSGQTGQNYAENIPPAPPGLINLRSPSGQIVQLPEAMLKPALNSGFTQVQSSPGGTSTSGGSNASGGGAGTSGGGTGTGTTTPMDASQYRAKLEAAGIPLDGLDDKQIQTLGMMQQVMQKKAENDQAILPKSLSQADLDSYMATAKDQLDPFYKEQFDLFKNDLLQNVSYLTGETQDEAATREQQFKQQRDQLQQQYTDLGMARSGIRNEAEKQLQANQQGVITSSRRALQQKIYQLGSQLEKTYGAKGNDLQPKIESPGSEVTGVGASTISYQPVGVNYATADQTQKAAEIARQTALATQEAAKRGFIQNGSYAAI